MKDKAQMLKMSGGAVIVLAAVLVVLPQIFSFAAGMLRVAVFIGVVLALAIGAALILNWMRGVQSKAAADIQLGSNGNGKHGEESEVHNRN